VQEALTETERVKSKDGPFITGMDNIQLSDEAMENKSQTEDEASNESKLNLIS
jgi:hypothetical protein